MGFQDNSGDIILDVVLTDEGRKRLASGDGRFKITKFALGDDEINYELFNVGAATAVQDLSILQTPILEAFTNNTASMKSKLLYGLGTGGNMLSIWYLPTLKLNTIEDKTDYAPSSRFGDSAVTFVVTADGNTHRNDASTGIGYSTTGLVNGVQNGGGGNALGGHIRVDCGFDTSDSGGVDKTIVETSFTIQMDHRLLTLREHLTGNNLEPSDVDDDNFALYAVNVNSPLISTSGGGLVTDGSTPLAQGGWLTNKLEFKFGANSTNLTSDYLFTRMGGETTMTNRAGAPSTVKYIDTIVRVVGDSLGISIDLPIRVVKI